MKRFTLEDATGSYAWATEGTDKPDVLSDEEIYEWVNILVEQSGADYFIFSLEEEAPTLKYPRFGYTTADIFETPDEWLEFKKAEFFQDLASEKEHMFNYLKSWWEE